MKKEETGAIDPELGEDLLDIIREFNMERAAKGEPLRKLGDMLAARSLTSLRKLASLHRIRGYTKMDRTALASALEARLTDQGALADIFLSMHDIEWNFFKKVAASGLFQDNDVYAGAYRDLQDLGIIYLYLLDGLLFFVVPDEIRAAYAKLRKTKLPAEREHCWMVNAYAAAAANLYGAVRLETLAEIFNSQNKRRASVDDMFRILLRYSRLDVGYGLWNDHIVSDDFETEDFEDVRRFAKEAESKPRYVPQKSEFLEHADWGYYEPTPQIAALKRYLERGAGIDGETAGDIVDELFVGFRSDEEAPDAAALFRAYEIDMDEAQLREALALAAEMGASTRRWALNGHTSREMLRKEKKNQPADAPRRVGRNDPCPCGSGKKYKKCCYLKGE
jgi:hypothetical protein